MRQGEKLYEELLADADQSIVTTVQRLRIAKLDDRPVQINALLDWAAAGVVQGGDRTVKQQLSALVPEYRASVPGQPSA